MTAWSREWKKLLWIVAVFLLFFWLPVGWDRLGAAVLEALHLARWYARHHVLLCLVPAFFIAGAIGVFVSQASVMKYLGARANKVLAYGVASVSGSILAVCSCTVLPLFAGIWRMGAGLGPATAFLYSGPAINVLAIILTARILGPQLGLARAIGAVGFSIVIGLAMHWIYRKEEMDKADGQVDLPEPETSRPLWQNGVLFFVMIGALVFANWGKPGTWDYRTPAGRTVRVDIVEAPFDPRQPEARYTLGPTEGGEQLQVPARRFLANRQPVADFWSTIWRHKWAITSVFALALAVVLVLWCGAAWWKVALAATAPAILAIALPSDGLWVLLPFAAGVAGLSVALGTSGGPGRAWLESSWTFAKQILPLLLIGVLIAGFLLGRPGHAGLIPGRYVELLVGDSPDAMLGATGVSGGGLEGVIRSVWPVWTNLFASVFGAFMYFATLTEVPILQGLLGAGMGKGPALALLLAGPALSLPNMLVIRSIMGTGKTVVFCLLVVVMATISGLIFGTFF
jgi:hypothetical protein